MQKNLKSIKNNAYRIRKQHIRSRSEKVALVCNTYITKYKVPYIDRTKNICSQYISFLHQEIIQKQYESNSDAHR